VRALLRRSEQQIGLAFVQLAPKLETRRKVCVKNLTPEDQSSVLVVPSIAVFCRLLLSFCLWISISLRVA